jgi:putative phosphoribosyl transferase
MRFANRAEAGQILAEELKQYQYQPDTVVLGLARGGVPVALEVAKALGLPFDVFILRKLGVPGHEELAFGAIATGGVHVLDEETIDAVGLSPADMHRALTLARQEMERRERRYRKDRHPVNVKGKTVILVDDGIATGSSMRAAIAALRKMQAARIVVAVPVAPPRTCERLRREADEVVCVYAPEAFYAVGAFYDDFGQVSDEEVEELLRRGSLMPDGKVA